MGDDANGHELLAVVSAVHHERVGEPFDDGAVGLAEPLDGISAGRVRDVDGCPDLNVVAKKYHQPLFVFAETLPSSACIAFLRPQRRSR